MKPAPVSSLPWFDSTAKDAIEKTFRATHAERIAAAIAPGADPALKDTIQEEYRKALSEGEKVIDAERARVAALNVGAFLADPRGVIEYLNEERGRSLYLGEMLIAYGIAVVTSKRRQGKGELRGKGTIAEGTLSPRVVTVRIGDRVKVYPDLACYNDNRSRSDLEQGCAEWFANEIAGEGKTP